MLMPPAGSEAIDGSRVRGQGNHPRSQANLQSSKTCGACGHVHGNKKAGKCGRPVSDKNPDGTDALDEQGNVMQKQCDFVFVSASQKTAEKLQREAMSVEEARLPTDIKKLQAFHISEVFHPPGQEGMHILECYVMHSRHA